MVYSRSKSSPPAYENIDSKGRAKMYARDRSKLATLGVIAVVVIIVVGVVVGAVFGSRSNAYPDYTALNYALIDTYSGTDFFDNFDYFTGDDPTAGFVHYVDSAVATSAQYNLTYASSYSAVLRVDTSETNASTGRYSVRITSKRKYNAGLFVFDVLSAPYGCSTWPALWLADPSHWPAHGEIDVMESVNQATAGNQVTLHTSAGCKMIAKRKETGSVVHKDCRNSTNDNAGCGVRGEVNTAGQAFNENGGAIYALEWRTAGIRVWFFDRDSIPHDLSEEVANTTVPDPRKWSTPLADFPSTNCDVSSHFKNQSIIANIDLCGAWAGATSIYNTKDACPGLCTDFVTKNNTAYKTAYWEWRSWRVYQAV